jgi:hypothetical protein
MEQTSTSFDIRSTDSFGCFQCYCDRVYDYMENWLPETISTAKNTEIAKEKRMSDFYRGRWHLSHRGEEMVADIDEANISEIFGVNFGFS